MKWITKYSARDLFLVVLIAAVVVATDYLILPEEVFGLEAGLRSLVFAFIVALFGAFREERGRR